MSDIEQSEPFKALEKAVMQYLVFLHSNAALNTDEFRLLRERVITLACNLTTQQRASRLRDYG